MAPYHRNDHCTSAERNQRTFGCCTPQHHQQQRTGASFLRKRVFSQLGSSRMAATPQLCNRLQNAVNLSVVQKVICKKSQHPMYRPTICSRCPVLPFADQMPLLADNEPSPEAKDSLAALLISMYNAMLENRALSKREMGAEPSIERLLFKRKKCPKPKRSDEEDERKRQLMMAGSIGLTRGITTAGMASTNDTNRTGSNMDLGSTTHSSRGSDERIGDGSDYEHGAGKSKRRRIAIEAQTEHSGPLGFITEDSALMYFMHKYMHPPSLADCETQYEDSVGDGSQRTITGSKGAKGKKGAKGTRGADDGEDSDDEMTGTPDAIKKTRKKNIVYDEDGNPMEVEVSDEDESDQEMADGERAHGKSKKKGANASGADDSDEMDTDDNATDGTPKTKKRAQNVTDEDDPNGVSRQTGADKRDASGKATADLTADEVAAEAAAAEAAAQEANERRQGRTSQSSVNQRTAAELTAASAQNQRQEQRLGSQTSDEQNARANADKSGRGKTSSKQRRLSQQEQRSNRRSKTGPSTCEGMCTRQTCIKQCRNPRCHARVDSPQSVARRTAALASMQAARAARHARELAKSSCGAYAVVCTDERTASKRQRKTSNLMMGVYDEDTFETDSAMERRLHMALQQQRQQNGRSYATATCGPTGQNRFLDGRRHTLADEQLKWLADRMDDERPMTDARQMQNRLVGMQRRAAQLAANDDDQPMQRC